MADVLTKFEASKLRTQLRRTKTSYLFQRAALNEFGEPEDGYEDVGSICALYHEENSNVQITTAEGAQIRTKKIPMLLCLYDDEVLQALKVGDVTILNGKTFKVTGVVNVQEWNIVADVSLEVVDDGTNIKVQGEHSGEESGQDG